MKYNLKFDIEVDTRKALRKLNELEKKSKKVLYNQYQRGFNHGLIIGIIGMAIGFILGKILW